MGFTGVPFDHRAHRRQSSRRRRRRRKIAKRGRGDGEWQ
jgi:hypothetical protein